MRRSPSLVRRLWLASALVLPVFIGISSITLHRAYVSSLDSAEYDALLSQIYALLAIAEPDSDSLMMPELMANPRFETADSGLYARISDHTQHVIWRSNSLSISQHTFAQQPNPSPGSIREHWIDDKHGAFRGLSFTTVWELDGQDKTFNFDIIHSQSAKQQEIRAYRKTLITWLGGMAALILFLQVAITLWGLRPLKSLAKEINQIEQGGATQLNRRYPVEIEPVTHSLNKLLHSEASQRERYKNSLSDLAHSLKTPLSVIRSQLDGGEKDAIVDQQVERMASIINHQLRRASAQVQSLYGPSTQLQPLCERITNALAKVYRDKNISVELNIPSDTTVEIDEDDCMEVLGNILENAFKYGKSHVLLRSQETSAHIELTIEDDGPGIPDAIGEDILKRGARVDTSQSGQGIGLAIAVDILSSYNGGLGIYRSTAGGAGFRINIPKFDPSPAKKNKNRP